MPAKLFRTLFEHKAWANQDLLTQLITHQQPEQAKSWRLATRLMNHLNIVDQIFIAHLMGQTHRFTATNTPETPDLLELQSRTAVITAFKLAVLSVTARQKYPLIF
jgi:hypothetical protein